MSEIPKPKFPTTDTAKILFEQVRAYVQGVAENGYDGVDEDLKQYIFEAAVQHYYGYDIFKQLNRIDNERRGQSD
jgi:hypothetical protein